MTLATKTFSVSLDALYFIPYSLLQRVTIIKKKRNWTNNIYVILVTQFTLSSALDTYHFLLTFNFQNKYLGEITPEILTLFISYKKNKNNIHHILIAGNLLFHNIIFLKFGYPLLSSSQKENPTILSNGLAPVYVLIGIPSCFKYQVSLS